MALKTFRPSPRPAASRRCRRLTRSPSPSPRNRCVESSSGPAAAITTAGITSRHIGGGHKQKYRIIDFKRKKRDIDAEVIAIEYDPNRTARIALLQYTDGEKTYILAPAGLDVGAKVIAGENVAPEVGNALPLSAIPLGTAIHNVEITAGRGGQIARSAGQQVILNNREAGYALVKMPSGEIRKIQEACYATIGQVGNVDHMNVKSGKAGRTRWQGRRPHVRGMVMNPVDHPMGGGQGKSKGGGGRHHPVSPWGQLGQGLQDPPASTRPSDVFIVERRKSKKKTK